MLSYEYNTLQMVDNCTYAMLLSFACCESKEQTQAFKSLQTVFFAANVLRWLKHQNTEPI